MMRPNVAVSRLFSLLVMVVLSSVSAFSAEEVTTASILEARQEKDHEIRLESIGPFTAMGQAELRSGKAMRVALRPDTLLLDRPTADIGIPTVEVTWKKETGDVYVRIPMGGRFFLGRQMLTPVPMKMQPGDTLRAGRFLLQVYRGKTTARIMAFDPSHPKRLHFKGLHYFAPNAAWRVEALVERVAEPDTVAMTTSLGLTKYYLQHSKLHFPTPEGIDQTLTLFVPLAGEPYGFIPFTDATTGNESYGAGRYLDLEPPAEGQETMMIDFNDAYNPYCAYTDHYNCPIPPAENQLTVAVEAGEKSYK